MKYRPEIDGLRAISVLSVFLFHLGDKSASGGFVGVDIFFVISGYLITTLIYTERTEGRFSLIAFYVRRVKRIAPALLTMIFVALSAGYFILYPSDYDSLAHSSLFALVGTSNFFFLENTGYFDAAAEAMPILHTWSLGVEEQFYVIWPSLLVIIWWFGRKNDSIVVLLFMLITTSLATYLVLNSIYPKIAFYMPFSRAWEFALGGVIPFLPNTTDKRFSQFFVKGLPWLGVILIGAAVLQFRAPVDFTGNKVVASALGACLVIYATRPNSIIYQILSSKPFVFIGKISYSLYLFHFPIIVFWKYYVGTRIIPHRYDLLFILSAVVISWLSWRYIEQPCRRAKWEWKAVFTSFLIGEVSIASLCAAVIVTQGAAIRVPESVRTLRSLDWPCPSYHSIGESSVCMGGAAWDTAAAHVVIWGDSNAEHFMPFLDMVGRQQDVSVLLTVGCEPAVATGYAMLDNPGTPTYMDFCDEAHSRAFNLLQSKDIDMIILAAAWGTVTPRLYKSFGDPLGEENGLLVLNSALNKLLPQISAKSRKVVIISQVPEWSLDPIPCVIAVQTRLLRSASFREFCRDKVNSLDKAYFLKHQKKTDDLLRSFNGKYGVSVYSPVDVLCSEQSCTTIVDGEFIYRDEGHLRMNLRERTNLDLANLLGFDQIIELAKKH